MSQLNVLIIEDETLLGLHLSFKIKELGYSVIDYVTTVDDALEALQHNKVDLLLLDIQLNDVMDGIELYNSLGKKIMVVFTTAYTDEKTLDRAIKTDPLGYLVKPINEKELLVLLKLAQTKIESSQNQTSYVIELANDYSFDMRHDILMHHNQHIQIGGKQLALLKLLVKERGNFVTFHAIEEELYKDSPPSESSLRTLIYRLRSLLTPEIIETQRNYGVKILLKS